MIRQSESITKISQALVNFQGRIEAIKKESINPHFKSKYADLAAIFEAIRGPLYENQLSILQFPSCQGRTVTITTRLLHSSGEYFENDFSVEADRPGAQAIGSAVTYGCRYSAKSILGLSTDDDDDGNAASPPPEQKRNITSSQGRKPSTNRGEPKKAEPVDVVKPKIDPVDPETIFDINDEKCFNWAGQVFDYLKTEKKKQSEILEKIAGLKIDEAKKIIVSMMKG